MCLVTVTAPIELPVKTDYELEGEIKDIWILAFGADKYLFSKIKYSLGL